MVTTANEVEVECESYASCHAASSCCIMTVISEIKSTQVTISESDNQIDGINFSENRNILFLPVLVYKKFPNLIAYYAFHCSIREISKKNFEKLSRLEDLNLNSNQIERIRSDTFEDLVALQQLHISECSKTVILNILSFSLSAGSNQIKQMNGFAIEKLIALDRLDLRNNQCINRWLRAENNLEEFNLYASHVITTNCYFDESDPEKLTREVETESLISEYSNMEEFQPEMLTGGVASLFRIVWVSIFSAVVAFLVMLMTLSHFLL